MTIQKILSKSIDDSQLIAQKILQKGKISRYPYIAASTYLKPEIKAVQTAPQFFSPTAPIGNADAPKIGTVIDFFAF